jgi:hypothetical protein
LHWRTSFARVVGSSSMNSTHQIDISRSHRKIGHLCPITSDGDAGLGPTKERRQVLPTAWHQRMGWPPMVSLHASYSIGDLEDVREVGQLEGQSLLAVRLAKGNDLLSAARGAGGRRPPAGDATSRGA